MQSCEVCDDTNATIHCQECRRKTCEECDEILHLVDANKSHHRIPLYPSRGASAVTSRSGSQVPTRNVSPRGPRRPFQEQEGIMEAYSSGNKQDWPPSPPQQHHSPPKSYDNEPDSSTDFAPRRFAPVQAIPVSQAPPPPRQPSSSTQFQSYAPPPPSSQPSSSSQFQSYAPPHEQQQQQQQQQHHQPQRPKPQQQQILHHAPPPPQKPLNQAPQQTHQRPPHSSNQPLQPYNRLQPQHSQSVQSRSGYATPSSYPQPGTRSLTHSGAATPTFGTRPVMYNQFSQQQHMPPPQQQQHMPPPQQQQHMPPPPQQQQQVYQHQNQNQQYGREANRHSRDDEMKKAYMQHMQVIEQHKAVEAHQRLMSQRNQMPRQPQQQQVYGRPGMPGQVIIGQQNVQGQLVNVLRSNMPSNFSSAAPSARNSPPLQPMARPVSMHIPGFYTPGSVSGAVTPGGQPHLMHMEQARHSWPQPQPQPQQMMQFVQAPPQPMYDPHRGNFGQPPPVYSVPASVPRTPYHEPRSPPGFMPQHRVPYGVSASVPRTPYNEPRTPYNEPRTPFEPRSPAAEPIGYGERFSVSRPVSNSFPPPPSQSMAPPPPRPAYTNQDFAPPPLPPNYGLSTMNNAPPPPQAHHPPPQAAPQMRAPPPRQQAPQRSMPPSSHQPLKSAPPPPQQQQFPSSLQPQMNNGSPYRNMDISAKPPTITTDLQSNPPPAPKEDTVMTPNGSLARIPVDDSAPRALPSIPTQLASAPRYDPDEAETRVRNLIADTERMLAGLSGFSSGRKTNGVSV